MNTRLLLIPAHQFLKIIKLNEKDQQNRFKILIQNM